MDSVKLFSCRYVLFFPIVQYSNTSHGSNFLLIILVYILILAKHMDVAFLLLVLFLLTRCIHFPGGGLKVWALKNIILNIKIFSNNSYFLCREINFLVLLQGISPANRVKNRQHDFNKSKFKFRMVIFFTNVWEKVDFFPNECRKITILYSIRGVKTFLFNFKYELEYIFNGLLN